MDHSPHAEAQSPSLEQSRGKGWAQEGWPWPVSLAGPSWPLLPSPEGGPDLFAVGDAESTSHSKQEGT